MVVSLPLAFHLWTFLVHWFLLQTTQFFTFSFYLFFLNPHPRTGLLILGKWDRREKWGREALMWERNIDHLLPVCSYWGPNRPPKHVSWPGIEPMTLRFMGWCSNQLSHTGQSSPFFFFFFVRIRVGLSNLGASFYQVMASYPWVPLWFPPDLVHLLVHWGSSSQIRDTNSGWVTVAS